MHLMFYYSVLLLLIIDKILLLSCILVTMTNLAGHTELGNYVDMQIYSKLSLV